MAKGRRFIAFFLMTQRKRYEGRKDVIYFTSVNTRAKVVYDSAEPRLWQDRTEWVLARKICVVESWKSKNNKKEWIETSWLVFLKGRNNLVPACEWCEGDCLSFIFLFLANRNFVKRPKKKKIRPNPPNQCITNSCPFLLTHLRQASLAQPGFCLSAESSLSSQLTGPSVYEKVSANTTCRLGDKDVQNRSQIVRFPAYGHLRHLHLLQQE